MSKFNRLILYQNVRGLKTKTHMFYENILNSDFDIICLTETWLDDTVHSSELFPPNFAVFRQDGRRQCRGRGVLVAVNHNAWRPVHLTHLTSDSIDMIWLTLTNTSGFSFFLCNLYFPPNSIRLDYESFYELVNNSLNELNGAICVVGDFNLPLITNSKFNLTAGGQIYVDLCFFLSLHNLVLRNDVTNDNDKTLDLVITNIPGLSVEREEDPLVPLDRHHPALSLCFYYPDHGSWHVTRTNEVAYNFKRADFLGLWRSLSNCDWQSVYSENQVDRAVGVFYDLVYDCLDNAVPKSTTRKYKYPKWYTPEIIACIKQKQVSRKKFLRSSKLLHFNQFREHRRNLKYLIAQAHRNYVLEIEGNVKSDPKKFWEFVKSKRSSVSSGPNVYSWNGDKFSDGKSVSDAFARYFASVFNDEGPVDISAVINTPVLPGAHSLVLNVISENEVLSAIRKLPSKRSFGPDLIPPYIFRACSDFFVKPLCYIFNLCLRCNTFPSLWKTARVIPLHKKGNRFEISNFRPVSIISTPAKVFELVLYSNIFPHVKSHITGMQHGFYPSRSIVTNLVNFTSFTSKILDCKGQVDTVYTDFSKAFDKVSHFVLLSKLNYYGFSNNLIKLFSSYLQNRQLYVSFEAFRSFVFSSGSGVPQGSNLGPLLFNVFINDVVNVLKCHVLMYADDMKLFDCISSADDCVSLQNDLNSLDRWCEENKLQLNVEKCTVMSYTRKLSPIVFPYSINNIVLSRTSSYRDLGVIMESDLSFKSHILSAAKRAYGVLGFILRISKLFSDFFTVKLLYKSLVRSKLEFASIIWSPYTLLHINIIEKVQKRFLRYLYYKSFGPLQFPIWLVRYKEMLEMFEFESLGDRRKVARLCYLRDVLSGIVDDPLTLSSVSWHVPTRGGRASRPFYPLLARTCAHANSFLVSTVSLFNSLGGELDVTMNRSAFKKTCFEYFRNENLT
jgi:hypothetical protein